MKKLSVFLAAVLLCSAASAAPGTAVNRGYMMSYPGTGAANNDIVLDTGELEGRYACTLQSTTGALNVFASIDGTNYATDALALDDYGAVTVDPVILTAPNRTYSFAVVARRIRVRQNGATATSATMNCRAPSGVEAVGLRTSRDMTVTSAAGWTLVNAGPSLIQIKSNSFGRWWVALSTSGTPAPTLVGELYEGEVKWEGRNIAGAVYVKVQQPTHSFSIAE